MSTPTSPRESRSPLIRKPTLKDLTKKLDTSIKKGLNWSPDTARQAIAEKLGKGKKSESTNVREYSKVTFNWMLSQFQEYFRLISIRIYNRF